MGVIKKQSILNSLVSYAGVILGMVNIIYIYPLISTTNMGILQFAVSSAMLFSPFAGWGLNTAAVRFFPDFKDNTNHHKGFFWYLFMLTVLICGIFTFGIWFFQKPVSLFFNDENRIMFLNTVNYIIAFTILFTYSNLFQSFASNIQKIVVPSFLTNFLIKISQPLLILFFYWGIINFAQIFKGLFWTFFTMTAVQFLYLVYLKQVPKKLDLKIWNLDNTKTIMSYSSFTILVNISSLLTVRLDQIMIAPLLGYASLAAFNFGVNISEAIDVARKSISSISAPLISESLKQENYVHLEEIYKKSALLQLIIGAFLLIGVWACSDSLFAMMPKNNAEYATGKYVILFLCLGRLVDMATGTNHEIITFSQYYRFNLWSLTILGIINIFMNLWLIGIYGITGAAIATMLSATIFNIWRMLFVYQKFKIHPLDFKMLWVCVIALGTWFIAWLTPSVSPSILNIFIKGAIVTLIYIPLIVFFKISKDVNETIEQVWNKIFK